MDSIANSFLLTTKEIGNFPSFNGKWSSFFFSLLFSFSCLFVVHVPDVMFTSKYCYHQLSYFLIEVNKILNPGSAIWPLFIFFNHQKQIVLSNKFNTWYLVTHQSSEYGLLIINVQRFSCHIYGTPLLFSLEIMSNNGLWIIWFSVHKLILVNAILGQGQWVIVLSVYVGFSNFQK